MEIRTAGRRSADLQVRTGVHRTRYMTRLVHYIFQKKGGENMKKVTKFIAVLLAALMLITSFAFADSKEKPSSKEIDGKCNQYIGYKDGHAVMIGVTKKTYNYKTKKVPKTTKIKGKTYRVTGINKNAFAKMKKLRTVKIYATKALKVQKGAFGKLKTKKITIKVTKKMSKSQFSKMKKNLRKAGFKGTIKRVKL